MELLQHPVVIGILSALAGALIAWVAFLFEKIRRSAEMKRLKKDHEEELVRLKEHLNNQMEITSEGTKSYKDQIDRLKQENENLRVTLHAYQQKPDRKEIRTLYVYDKAISSLLENAPGFGPMWVKSLREAEVEMEKTEKGLIAWTKNLLGLKGSQNLKAYKQEEVEEAETEEAVNREN